MEEGHDAHTHLPHNSPLNANAIKIPVGYGGLYLVSTTVWYAAGATGSRSTLILVNGSVVVEGGVATGGDTRPVAGWPLMLSDGDVLEMSVYAEGTGVQLGGSVEKDTSLALTKLT